MYRLLQAICGAAIAALSIGAAGCRSSGATTGDDWGPKRKAPDIRTTFAQAIHDDHPLVLVEGVARRTKEGTVLHLPMTMTDLRVFMDEWPADVLDKPVFVLGAMRHLAVRASKPGSQGYETDQTVEYLVPQAWGEIK